MKDIDPHFDTVSKIASFELDDSNGCQLLCDHLRSPFDSVNAMQIEDWVANLSRSLAKKCWGTRDFRSSCKTHGDHLFYVVETGDVPEVINVGYPMTDCPHTFQQIERLTGHSKIFLPQLLDNISTTSIDGEPYFERIDLFHCYLDDFGMKLPEIEDFDNMDASRLLVDSVAILAMIRSWRDLDPVPGVNVFFCTSSGAYAFGRPIRIQSSAR